LDKKLTANGILAQLALLLSFPHDSAKAKYSVHVQYSVGEGRTLSDELRPTSNADIIKTANEFVDRIVDEMKKGK
jgi:predicted cation transporter